MHPLWELFLTVLGAALGWLAADPDRVREVLRFRAERWTGQWWCVWCDAAEPPRWIVDGVQFRHSLGLLKFSVNEPGATYFWKASGKIGRYFYTGEWRSLRPQSTSHGVFAFELMPQGEKMVGYFLGTSDKGSITCFPAFMTPNRQIALALRADPGDQGGITLQCLDPAAMLARVNGRTASQPAPESGTPG